MRARRSVAVGRWGIGGPGRDAARRAGPQRAGQEPTGEEPSGAWPAVLALDLGGTQVRAAVVVDGELRAIRRARTPVEHGRDAIVATCLEILAAARRDYEGPGPSLVGGPPLTAVGMSTVGPVEPGSGVIIDPPNMGPTFRDVPLAARVAAATGLPAVLDRDTQCAALAEWARGVAQGCADFVYLTVSTGIGGAIVSGGRLIRGPDGTAGELGHLPAVDDGPPCGCGATGHLEAVSSGSGVARAARAAVAAGMSDRMAALLTERGEAFGAREVARAEAEGDATAAAIMARARDSFGRACVGLVNVFNPELIVVGGSLALSDPDRWLGGAQEAVHRLAFRTPGRRTRIVPAGLGDEVGLIGAAELVRERLG